MRYWFLLSANRFAKRFDKSVPTGRSMIFQIRPYIALFDTSMERFMHLFSVFIPLKMSAEEHERYGAGLWFDELWHFFTFVEMNSSWEAELPAIFAS